MRRSRSQQASGTSAGLPPTENQITDSGHPYSQASESLLTLDVDMPTILEEQEDEDIHDCPSEELAVTGVVQENTPAASPTDDTISPSPHGPIVSQTQEDDEDYPPSDDDSGLNGLVVDEGTDLDAMAAHINAQFDETDDVLSAELDSIVDHRYLSGIIELRVKYTNGDLSWHPMDLIKDENPHCVAVYVLNNDLGNISNGIHRRWARTFLRALKRTIRRMKQVDFSFIESSTYDPVVSKKARRQQAKRARRAQAEKPIPVPPKGKRTFKHGLEVPKNWKDIKRIDDAAGNTRWQDAVEKEVAALIMHKCFDFKTPDYKPTTDYQFCRLHLVYDIKNDLTYKARLVCNGSHVDPRGLSTRATVVKSISVRLLDLIADELGLQVLCGDIGNAFIQAMTKEKIYTRVGPEFGSSAFSMAISTRTLYGLTTSAERFRTLLADFLRSLGFSPSRYDRDVWMRLTDAKDGHDYIYTHVDDFKIIATSYPL